MKTRIIQSPLGAYGAPPPPTGGTRTGAPPPSPYGAALPPPRRARPTAASATHPLAGAMYWACSDLLTLASQLALGAVAPSFADLRRHVDQLFQAMQGRARASGITPEDATDAAYAIIALFDEILVQANWAGRSEWQASPLQYVHFQENTAGENFFRRTDALMRQPHRMHVLLVYFLCLALGFQGRYAMGGSAGLAPVYDAMGAMVGHSLPNADVVSPHGEPADAVRSLLQREAPIVRVAIGFFGAALVAFVLLRVLLSAQVSSAVEPMKSYAAQVSKR